MRVESSPRTAWGGVILGSREWRVGKVLGEGAMGVVELCFDSVGTSAARKSIRSSVGGDERQRARDRLWAEWLLMQSVKHPHLLQYYDCNRNRLHLYVEYAAKGDLESRCRSVALQPRIVPFFSLYHILLSLSSVVVI